MIEEAPVEAPPAEAPAEEAPPEEAPPVEETIPEADQRVEAEDPADHMDELLADEADDLDLDPEPAPPETPPEGQVPPTEGEQPPAEAPPSEGEQPPAPDATKPAETPPPAEAPPPEQAPTPPPEEAAPAEAPEPAPTMEQLREQYQANRAGLEKTVATGHYGLNEEQVNRLDDGDPQIIPELMAKVYMDALTGSVAHMITHLPHMMESMIESRDTNATNEKSFFDAWPQLNAAAHGETIGTLGAAYRSVNPTASAEDFIRNVGASALVALGIPPTEIGDAPAQGGNGGTTPVSGPQSAPFVPGGTGRGGSAPVDQPSPYDALASEMEAEELDLDRD